MRDGAGESASVQTTIYPLAVLENRDDRGTCSIHDEERGSHDHSKHDQNARCSV